jgi:hypothetical protein
MPGHGERISFGLFNKVNVNSTCVKIGIAPQFWANVFKISTTGEKSKKF